MRGTAAADTTSKSEEEGNTTGGGSAESVVTWLYPQEGNMEPSNETGPTDGVGQVEPTISNPSMTSAWSSFFSSGGLVSSAFDKVSSGVAAATTSIKQFDITGEEAKSEPKNQDDDVENNDGKDQVELGFGISSVLSKMGSATKALKQSVESTSIISEFNREQEKFIKEKKESDANVGAAPWVGYRDEDGLRGKILELSKDKRNFVRSPPSGVTFDFEYESISGAALTLLREDPNLHEMRFQLVPKLVKEDEFWRNYFYRVGLVRQQFELQELQDIDKDDVVGSGDKSNEGTRHEIEDEGADSGSRAADVEEFVSESYLASSKDIAEADESLKKLGVSDESTNEWEAELQGELNEYEVVKESADAEDDNPEWENQIQEMLDAEQNVGNESKVSD